MIKGELKQVTVLFLLSYLLIYTAKNKMVLFFWQLTNQATTKLFCAVFTVPRCFVWFKVRVIRISLLLLANTNNLTLNKIDQTSLIKKELLFYNKEPFNMAPSSWIEGGRENLMGVQGHFPGNSSIGVKSFSTVSQQCGEGSPGKASLASFYFTTCSDWKIFFQLVAAGKHPHTESVGEGK